MRRLRDADLGRKWCLFFAGLTFACARSGTWQDFACSAAEADDRWHLLSQLFPAARSPLFVIDQLSAPLLSLVALLYFLTTTATLRTKIRRFSFAWTLASEAITLATFSCKSPWLVIALLAAGTMPPYPGTAGARQSRRGFMCCTWGLFVGLMVIG